jgi:hypothetical protein
MRKEPTQVELADLATDDPVRLYDACQHLTAEQAQSPAIRKRLIEILDDDCDWDCGHFVAVEALAALARADADGGFWMQPAGDAIRRHIEHQNTDLVRAMIGVAQLSMPVRSFLDWANQIVPQSTEDDEPWIMTVLHWGVRDWYTRKRFMSALLSVLDDRDRLAVFEELVFQEEILQRWQEHKPAEDVGNVIQDLRRWTKDAPPQARDAGEARASDIWSRVSGNPATGC